MVAGSILPVSMHNGEIYFLFGKENPLEDSAKGWSDFGGGVENGETPFQTALREGGEELTGFLGDNKMLRRHIKKSGGFYKLQHNDYHIHAIILQHDENLVKYYNQNHRFLWDRMDHQVLSKTKLFEKIEIGWFSISDMKRRINQFRGFYQEIVKKIIGEEENLCQFIQKKASKTNTKTRKNKRV